MNFQARRVPRIHRRKQQKAPCVLFNHAIKLIVVVHGSEERTYVLRVIRYICELLTLLR